MPKKSITDQSHARQLAQRAWIGKVREVAFFVFKKTGKTFPYVLCDLCTVQSRVNPQAIFRNVEAYIDADIVGMDGKAGPPQA